MVRYIAILLALSGCSTDDSGAGGARGPDSDRDGIADLDEGRELGVDTDRDGTPDFQDDDSDGDGLSDSYEGDRDREHPPRDSDFDRIPDFQDLDSDGNEVDDTVEGTADPDRDREPSFRDLDDDGDTTLDLDEAGEVAWPELDTDRDGTPDRLDLDSDADTINDVWESQLDVDRDGTPDLRDLDTDGDGYLDRDEAGDLDLTTPPFDSDSDNSPDFRDSDRDDDGLGDREERVLGTNPDAIDTDGDEISDLVEVQACTDDECAGDVLDPMVSPRTRGDFVVLARYQRAPLPERQTLGFGATVQRADVYFLIDTTSSMGPPLASLKAGLSTAGTGLIDRARVEIDDTWFGVGGYEDYAEAPYGGAGDRAYYHASDVSESSEAAQRAVDGLSIHWGGDGPEALIPALFSAATGHALAGPSGLAMPRSSCPNGGAGWPCFREDAVPVIVAITDRPTHNGVEGVNGYGGAVTGAPSWGGTVDALREAGVKVMGIAVRVAGDEAASGQALRDLEYLAEDTGAVDLDGQPLVSSWSGGELGPLVVEQIRTLAHQTPLDIDAVFEDDGTDGVDTRAFVQGIEARVGGGEGCEARDAVDRDGNGSLDTFEQVPPGAHVCFDLVMRTNTTVLPGVRPQLWRAKLRLRGDGRAGLEEHDVLFLVPAVARAPGPG